MNFLTELELECLKYDAQLLLVWSFKEAGMYIRTLKAYENKNSTTIQGRSLAVTPMEQSSEVLSSIRRVNKTDAGKLLNTYGSL